MDTVRSSDGTPIAFARGGRGPPLLLVHGVLADHTTTWRSVRRALEGHFAVFAMDRRGRGGSGDGAAYALEREAEDVAAVVDAVGEPVHVLGHSFGALCALEAALRTEGLDRLVLYEGVPVRAADAAALARLDRLEALQAVGDVEAMLVAMLRDVVGMRAGDIEILRAQREAWAARLRNAVRAPRELRAEAAFTFDADRFRGVRVPTLLLVGGDSPVQELENARTVAGVLPAARVAVMPGQQHIAMHTAPAAFVEAVVGFLLPRGVS